ncbi:MAG TPA: ribonuclease Y [Candidatus Nanopelagicaceae bacterium]|nr:ribonuclease Y [Candidatus Nanopelagicaceae bacterium]
MTAALVALAVVLALVAVAAVVYAIRASRQNGQRSAQELEAVKAARAELETERKSIGLEARAEALRIRTELEDELRERRTEISRQEQRILQREEQLDRQQQDLLQRSEALTGELRAVDEDRSQVAALRDSVELELERVAGMTRDQARREVLEGLDRELVSEKAERIRHVLGEAKLEADERAREVLVTTIQRHAADQTGETSVSVVPLPNDEIKGRIIGREGRNIRALESALGVDLIIDDTPETVVLSSFDPVRREVARVSLTKLLSDGRIHPTRIEEVVAKSREEVAARIVEEGEKALFELGLQAMHPELIKLIGILRYRYSYGQNVLAHVKEVAYLSGMIAAEIGADERLAKEAGMFHDIGKAVDHEVEGSHAIIGGEILKRLGRHPDVVEAVQSHHYDIEPSTVLSFIILSADAISASRPGARRETLASYIKRLEKLEEIANDFPGVERSFAIQAGREVRILVRPDRITDDAAVVLARDVARRIEGEMSYPGTIKVTVVRETRSVDYAK